MLAGVALSDDLASAAVHLGGLVATLLWSALLFRRSATLLGRIGVGVLGAAWLVLYTTSVTYHLTRFDRVWSPVALALDDAAIFIAIAGTYTPVVLWALPSEERRLVLTLLWVGAAAGLSSAAAATAAGYVHWYQPSLVFLCATAGWSPALAYCRTLARILPRRTGLMLLASGLVYLIGACFYRSHSLAWHHTYWHIAVLIGCFLDFTVVATLLRMAEQLGAPARARAPVPIRVK